MVAGESSKVFDIPSLNGIRALSFFIVFLSHDFLGHSIPGQFGVTVFFFLSGYLITTLLRKEFEAQHTISLRNFYLRRVLRIVPPIIITVMVMYLLWSSGLLPGTFQTLGVFSLFGFFANYIQIFWPEIPLPLGSGLFWSLAVEEHFYLLFPLFFLWGMNKFKRETFAFVLLVICALVLLWRIVLVFHFNASSAHLGYGTDTRMDSILFGCILALYKNPYLDKETWAENTYLAWGVALFFLAFSFIYREEIFRQTWRYTLQGIGLTPLFSLAIIYYQRIPFTWLNNAFMNYIGNLSYSLYLIHFALLYVVTYQLPESTILTRGVIAMTFSLGYSALMWKFVEKPFAVLRRNLLTERITKT